jgi:hypothetical protein
MDPQQIRSMIPGPYPTTFKAEGIASTPVAKQSFIRMMPARILYVDIRVSKLVLEEQLVVQTGAWVLPPESAELGLAGETCEDFIVFDRLRLGVQVCIGVAVDPGFDLLRSFLAGI